MNFHRTERQDIEMKRFLTFGLVAVFLFSSISTAYASTDIAFHRTSGTEASVQNYDEGAQTEHYEGVIDGEFYVIDAVRDGDIISVSAKNSDGEVVMSAKTLPDHSVQIVEDGRTTIIEAEELNAGLNTVSPLASGNWGTTKYYKWDVGKVTKAASLALAIACTMSGIGIPDAIGIATGIVELGVDHVWAKTGVSWKFDSKYQYCRRVSSFYKNSACTKKVAGPVTIIQKKAKDAA